MSHHNGLGGKAVGHTVQGSSVQDANGHQNPTVAAVKKHPRHPRPFTFIEHNDSLATKRIRDPKARRAIRSHVMRDVRFREKQQGKRRGQKREVSHERKDQGTEPSASASSESTISDESSPRSEDLSPNITKLQSPADTISTLEKPWEISLGQRQMALTSRARPQTPSPTISERLSLIAERPQRKTSLECLIPSIDLVDPFHALPGGASHSKLIQGLLRHCVDVFLPSLFFVQTKISTSKQNGIISSVMQSVRAEPASFYAILTVCAAHRSLLQHRKRELLFSEDSYTPDRVFVAMESKAFREFNVKLSGPNKLENSSFEAILALIGATAALVLESRPLFPVYDRSPRLKAATLERVKPPVDSVLASLGTNFCQVPQLATSKLMKIIEDLRIIIFLSDFGFRKGHLNPEEELLFSRKHFELEHDLLEYPHVTSNVNSATRPIEEVVRTALLCLSNTSLIHVAPASALRRAAVSHLMKALDALRDIFSTLSDIVWDLVMWALYIGIDGACGQPEEENLILWLGCLAGRRPKMDFIEIVNRCCGFFYVPFSMEQGWKRTWEKVKRQIELPYMPVASCNV
ncbi:MAG: hypothetical protein Q9160_005411 [Pyrenula sp. 1 TL-2023]